ncbi:carbohydrate ABC transporter permease [Intrasporangium calvum]|uniref:Carbohydrate ABC transporter membrane protein 2, CUT1 family n=1 Tax=Intrasporangium calvum (strain ATCC 23552 / DSM 43043 / JCM 3097 / NBRC 12989 / NCIMB 10167 / NRRL B-3866 / 7 KIP) TaxID=710696 RepID=E6S925_INTC7|nr:carbohydrate ABC transporter permease [Intrasporangium calvum]ADU49200.1 carbohydrate ABC transporter membrane protein 2, CUT1 family [Intrasporangium calvum DSM 43043]
MSRRMMKDGRPLSPFSIVVMTLLTLLWSIPTIGLLVTSFRSRDDAAGSGWWSALFNPFASDWTTSNYSGVWTGQDFSSGFINSIVVAIPATIIPIMFAAFAAYAFTFMDFPFKEFFFLIIIAVMVVPIQVAFQPMLDILGPRGLGISGSYIGVWLLHTGFGMPLCIYVLRNYMSTLPLSVVESAKIDGATHFQTFWKLVAPMSIPAIAAFATLQFLWVWNDLLVAKLFLNSANTTVIVKLQQLLGTQGQGQELLTAGAFISIVVPMIVFVALQRYMVRGMTSGAVKG